jgi:hypothetical protein
LSKGAWSDVLYRVIVGIVVTPIRGARTTCAQSGEDTVATSQPWPCSRSVLDRHESRELKMHVRAGRMTRRKFQTCPCMNDEWKDRAEPILSDPFRRAIA